MICRIVGRFVGPPGAACTYLISDGEGVGADDLYRAVIETYPYFVLPRNAHNAVASGWHYDGTYKLIVYGVDHIEARRDDRELVALPRSAR